MGKLKINSKAMLLLWGAIILLAACNTLTPSPTAKPTEKLATASISPTNTLDPFLATPYPPTPDPNINIIVTPNPDQQVYIDPEGWYSVNFPAEMKPGKKPNSFWSNRIGDFETGYLPEMGYVSNVTFVCAWLANIEFEPEKSSTNGHSGGTECSASNNSDGFKISYLIHENPGADPEHRFVYIKTKSYTGVSSGIETAFSWLKPVAKTRLEAESWPLSPEDAAFWNNSSPMPPGVSVTEYAVPPGNPKPSMHGLDPYVPTEAEPTRETNISTPTPHRTTYEQLGYTSKRVAIKPYIPTPGTGCQFCKTQLYRDGRLLFDDVYNISHVYTFSTDSGPINVFLVGTATDKNNFDNFLIENDAILAWDSGFSDDIDYYDFLQPLLYKNELLWLKPNAQDQVRKSDRQVIFSFVTYDESPMLHFQQPLGIKKFISWESHWILTFGSFLVQDGEFINKKLGYQEIFGWNLIHNKPAYFFSKGARFGISYDGQVLPLQYDEIANGLCCWNNGAAPVEINAYIYGDSARFFGRRNGVWYHVVVKFK